MEQRTIFVADDEPSLRRIYRRVLTAAGYRVFEFADASDLFEQLLELPLREHPDLILTDRSMPVMSGEALADAVFDAGFELPVLMVTGDELSEMPRYVEALVKKPFLPEELLAAVSGLIDDDSDRPDFWPELSSQA